MTQSRIKQKFTMDAAEPYQTKIHLSDDTKDTKNFMSNDEENMLLFLGACIPLFIILIYFLPWVVSLLNNHPAKVGIFVLNLFLGWTLVFWVIALVWAFTKSQPPQQVVVYQNTPPCSNPAQPGSLNIGRSSDDLHNKTG